MALVLLGIGLVAFGGPAAHVAFMRREIVERRRWLEEPEFRRMFAACSLVPGPSSTELAIFIGYRLAGWPGLLLSGALFIAPATLLMLGIAWAYGRFGAAPTAAAALAGVGPVVVGILAWALLDLGRSAPDRLHALAIAAPVALLYLLGVGPVPLLAAGGLALLAIRQRGRWRRLGGAWLALGWPPAAVAVAHAERLPVLAWTFLKLGAISFGSGYVLFAYLRADFVDGLHWLSQRQLVDAIAIAQVTPGPIFATATFLGYLFAGVAGALLATAAIFLPAFVLVPFLDRVVRLVERSAAVRVFLDGVGAAVLGLIAGVAVQLAGGSIHGPPGALVAAAALAVLWWRPLASPAVVVAGAALGVLTGGVA